MNGPSDYVKRAGGFSPILVAAGGTTNILASTVGLYNMNAVEATGGQAENVVKTMKTIKHTLYANLISGMVVAATGAYQIYEGNNRYTTTGVGATTGDTYNPNLV